MHHFSRYSSKAKIHWIFTIFAIAIEAEAGWMSACPNFQELMNDVWGAQSPGRHIFCILLDPLVSNSPLNMFIWWKSCFENEWNKDKRGRVQLKRWFWSEAWQRWHLVNIAVNDCAAPLGEKLPRYLFRHHETESVEWWTMPGLCLT